jgi:hypothetical protein
VNFSTNKFALLAAITPFTQQQHKEPDKRKVPIHSFQQVTFEYLAFCGKEVENSKRQLNQRSFNRFVFSSAAGTRIYLLRNTMGDPFDFPRFNRVRVKSWG